MTVVFMLHAQTQSDLSHALVIPDGLAMESCVQVILHFNVTKTEYLRHFIFSSMRNILRYLSYIK